MEIRESAAFFTGAYAGWLRDPGGRWEDLVGSVKLECTPDEKGTLSVTITTVEFGVWTGCLDPQREILEGSTGQGDSYFRCTLRRSEAGAGVRYSFLGGIYERPATLLYELRLNRDR